MKRMKSMQETCSLLNRIKNVGETVSAFLYLYGYAERPDIMDSEDNVVNVGIMLNFDATATRRALQKVCDEQKENGHPEIAAAALKLALYLGDLEKEILDKNTE